MFLASAFSGEGTGYLLTEIFKFCENISNYIHVLPLPNKKALFFI